jgi:hypothetical protein
MGVRKPVGPLFAAVLVVALAVLGFPTLHWPDGRCSAANCSIECATYGCLAAIM